MGKKYTKAEVYKTAADLVMINEIGCCAALYYALIDLGELKKDAHLPYLKEFAAKYKPHNKELGQLWFGTTKLIENQTARANALVSMYAHDTAKKSA